MKLTSLIQDLLNESNFTNSNAIAVKTKNTQPFTDAFLTGSKNSRQKEDLIFEELTKDITSQQLIAAIKLIKALAKNSTILKAPTTDEEAQT